MPPDPGTVFGFNSDVAYHGRTYHVQTESTGDAERAAINTLVYLGGTLVRKVTSSDADLTGGGDAAALEERVRRQHKDVLARISRGEIP